MSTLEGDGATHTQLMNPSFLTAADPLLPSAIESLLPAALEFHRAGQLAHADELYGRLMADLPRLAQVIHLRGLVAHSRGEVDLTIRYAAQAAALDPSNSEYHNLLGSGYFNAGRHDEALAAYRQAIAVSPDNALAYSNVSLALQALGRFHESLEMALQAIAIQPAWKHLQLNVGISLIRLGRHREAIPYLHEAVAADPNNVTAWLTLGHLHKELGEFEAAARAYEGVLQRAPTDGHAILGLALIRRFNRSDLPWCVALEQHLANPQLRAIDRYSIHFALGKVYEDIGHYAVAFEHYRRGHALNPMLFERSEATDRLNAARNLFSREWFANRAGFGCTTTGPIFIVGMFRSGSTLTEQTLASHPLVHGAGELPDIERLYFDLPRLTGGQSFADCFNTLTPGQVQAMANDYLNLRRAEMGNQPFFTDKMLVNFWNLGLIALLFPRAKIVHCFRDPRDTCISCYTTRFTDQPTYASRLANLGFYYRSYVAMMDHWRRVLPMPIFDVPYEEMVADQRGVTRRLLEFCELPWDERCLHFQTNDRPISTSSDWQIRQPIFRSSIGRWRRFAPYLTELFEALEMPLPA